MKTRVEYLKDFPICSALNVFSKRLFYSSSTESFAREGQVERKRERVIERE